MCGIAGFVGTSISADGETSRSVLKRMCGVIRHRGPDDEGVFVDREAALGMRRLSIIAVATGHQPIANETGTMQIVFNGEIYNYQTLRRELEAHGHTFKTDSDTETILHAYEQFGARCVERLRGMFAFAIWDSEKRELFVARDRVGKKPLYYAGTKSGGLLFASELKSLLVHPDIKREIDLRALDAYLTFGYVPDPLSILRGVAKLPPASHLTWTADGEVRIERYWDFDFNKNDDDAARHDAHNGSGANNRERDESFYVAEVRRLLDEAVRVRLVSEVPLGAFLSGGVDSSVVVGLMARHMSAPVKTFSIGFREDSFDELKYARIAAKHFGTEHHEFVVTPDICQIVDQLVYHFDEPFADSSAIPTYMVSKMAREHVTVALSGDGGDELFAGYTRYQIDRHRSNFARVPRFVRRGMVQPFSRRLPHGAPGRNFLYNVALDPLDRYIDSVSTFTDLNKHALYAKDFAARLREDCGQHTATEMFRSIANETTSNDPLERILYLDSKTYLPGDILTKVDRMSMAASLEARAPLLDHELIDFVTRIPSSLKMRGLETKYIFKQAVRDFVPPEILDRRKQGFGVPISVWINQELRDPISDALTDTRARARGYFDPSYIELLFNEHRRGRRDHSQQLWALYIFELWQRAYLDADGFTSETVGNEEIECATVGVS